MPPRCPCPNPGTWDYPVCGERTLRQGDCPGLPGWTQPHYMKFFWLQKTKQMVQARLYPLSLTLKMEDGALGPSRGMWLQLEAGKGLQFTAGEEMNLCRCLRDT